MRRRNAICSAVSTPSAVTARTELVGERDHPRHQWHVILRAGDVANEGAIDLQPVDGEGGQLAEAGVPGAEVVDGDGDARGAQAAELSLSASAG